MISTQNESNVVRVLRQSSPGLVGCCVTLHRPTSMMIGRDDKHDDTTSNEHHDVVNQGDGSCDPNTHKSESQVSGAIAGRIQMMELVWDKPQEEQEESSGAAAAGHPMRRFLSRRSRVLFQPHAGSISRFQVVWSLSTLETLNLHQYPHAEFPPGMAQLQMLKHFSIHESPNLTTLPDDITSLQTNLESIIIRNCDKLETIPAMIGKLSNLRYLELHGCASLASFPSSICDLKAAGKLTELQITRCERIRHVPPGLVLLESVKTLTLDYTTCPAFSSIRKDFFLRAEMRSLERFEVRRWHCVESNFPFEICNFATSLQELDLSDCDRFSSILVAVIPKLQNLKSLSIRYCPYWKTTNRQARLDPERGHDVDLISNLKGLRCLENLCLEGIAADDARHLLSGRPWNGSAELRRIDLSGCRLGNGGYDTILKGLPPSLTQLDLRQNGIVDLGGFVNVKLPKGVHSILLDDNPVFEAEPRSNNDSNSPSAHPIQILTDLLRDNPQLGRLSHPSGGSMEDANFLITPPLRAQLWFNRCSLFLLRQHQQAGGRAEQEHHIEDKQPHFPISIWANILARVNVIFGDAHGLEVHQRADIMYSFLQDYPIWTTL
eukprot:CAMPEP_0116996186 /NCGR_PEP_ID=MMETSP0472-20121206/83_1 /TAXON_ID=693140 ORGANISM="Tiarina fusus, Strain LIS" /NCGR_SAMPLE_ID=MMETSP0472 /ASSEMBLY_ACC=CAM_ASM_000603 /LENGTH=605 /DNA_ID=CAMNT_0004694737 /DNA_START=11 /DNA_END=1828 /DNA_ORIENTATION=+